VCNAGASNAGRSLCVQISREQSYPCQYIGTTRKAIDCATTLPLRVVCIVRAGVQPALWTHTLRPLYSRPIALTQEGRSQVDDVCECVRD